MGASLSEKEEVPYHDVTLPHWPSLIYPPAGKRAQESSTPLKHYSYMPLKKTTTG